MTKNSLKIGRNDACPCGSGQKYKRCCLRRGQSQRQVGQQVESDPALKLRDEITRIQRTAANREADFRELGVFLFFSTTEGDAWLLEITESDAAQVARAGESLELHIEEGDRTIAINWSHTFRERDRQLVLTSYADQLETLLPSAPAQRIFAAIRRIRKRYDQALLDQVHMPGNAAEATTTTPGE